MSCQIRCGGHITTKFDGMNAAIFSSCHPAAAHSKASKSVFGNRLEGIQQVKVEWSLKRLELVYNKVGGLQVFF